jgi:ribonuclease P protein component
VEIRRSLCPVLWTDEPSSRPEPEKTREKNIPAQQACAQAPPWLPCTHGHCWRPQGHRRPSRPRPQAPVGVKFSRRFGAPVVMTDRPNAMRLIRLTRRKDFLAAASGRRFRCAALNIQIRDRDDDVGLRVGFTASRKAGNAVQRNRIRRRLKVAADQALSGKADLSMDLVIVARHDVLRQSFASLVADITAAPARARQPKPRPDFVSKTQPADTKLANTQPAVTRS